MCTVPKTWMILLTTIGTQGIDVLEGPKLPSATLDKKFDESEEGEDVELDLTPGALEKNQRSRPHVFAARWEPCRLLTREGEVEIAKRIERGQTARTQGSVAFAHCDSRIAGDGRRPQEGRAVRSRKW